MNRVFDSSGPEGKVRGTPQQIIDKYNQLARDAQLSNDRVAAENFQQHAEHYLRLLSEAQREQDARREEQERQNRERQAERDRDRTERQEREVSAPVQDSPSDPALAPQPDVVDLSSDTSGEDSGLVETPESKPKKPPAPRRSRARKPKETPSSGDTEESSATSAPDDKPEAPEAAE